MNAVTSALATLRLSGITERFSYDSLRNGSLQGRLSNLKSIGDFFDVRRLSKPQGWGDAQSRIQYNLSYFSTNYAIVFALLSVWSLLTNLLLLFVIILVVVGMFGIGMLQGQDLVLPFATITTSSLYTTLFIIAVPLGIFASPLSTLFWLIGASGVTILGHATLMDKPIESAFGEEQV